MEVDFHKKYGFASKQEMQKYLKENGTDAEYLYLKTKKSILRQLSLMNPYKRRYTGLKKVLLRMRMHRLSAEEEQNFLPKFGSLFLNRAEK